MGVSAQAFQARSGARRPAPGLQLQAAEQAFVEAWSGLARGFGMDATLGRVHALSYLAVKPVRPEDLAPELGLSAERVAMLLDELVAYGVVTPVEGRAYRAEPDPWSWFVGTLRERGRREFSPLLDLIRSSRDQARSVRNGLSADRHARIERIERFAQFVEQIARLLEVLSTVGAGPLLGAIKMASRFVPRG